jgi:hypothetical protein
MRAQLAEQASFVSATKLMFPNAHHLPAASAQSAVYAAVAGLVAGEFGEPERGAGCRPGGVLGQPCQKQPSTKTATRSLRKTKSGFTRNGFNL